MIAKPQICAVITETTCDAARNALEMSASVADLAELRLDYLQDFDFADINSLARILEGKRLPVIITCRSIDEGGHQSIDDSIRLRLLAEGAKPFADYCDVEAAFYEQAVAFSPDITRLIVSYHNFAETPANLEEVYNRVTALPAAVHKIVTRANTITDSIAIFKLLERATTDNKRLIAIAMGPAGGITRVLGPSRGSFLTYGSLAEGKESADGQFTCQELASLYRVRRLSRETAVTGIIGSPVGHSASPAIHNSLFAELDLDFVYLPFEVSNVTEFVSRMVNPKTREFDWNLQGFSVTIPHKSAIVPLLDALSAQAKAIEAVNTVVTNGIRLTGHNTDVDGAMSPLEKVCALERTSCGVIGAGGAARAVIGGLLARGARVTVFAREPSRAHAVSQAFNVEVLPIEKLASSELSVIINTTPVGMRGHSENSSPVPAEALRGCMIAYDLVYNPLDTKFLIDARAAGCKTIDGLEMLIAQAALQFELWTGKSANIETMRRAARKRITGS
jgi:3-dehydroquinate dehydratase / shikimate dehydrogenase